MGIIMAHDERYDFFSDKYIQINSCGKYDNRGYTIIRKNGRQDYHLLYVYSGSCTAVYENTTYTLLCGNFILYNPGQTQEYTFSDEETCTTLWLHFTGKAIPEILNELNLNPGVYQYPPSEKVISVFNEIIREFQLKQYMHSSAGNALLIYLLTNISRHISEHRDVSDIEKVIMLMHDKYPSAYSPELYADMCALSQSRFSHKFKETTGFAPLQYFINIKLEKAKELLAFSSMNISEIAENVGYDNALYFSRLFRKNTGFSPSEYRKKYK